MKREKFTKTVVIYGSPAVLLITLLFIFVIGAHDGSVSYYIFTLFIPGCISLYISTFILYKLISNGSNGSNGSKGSNNIWLNTFYLLVVFYILFGQISTLANGMLETNEVFINSQSYFITSLVLSVSGFVASFWISIPIGYYSIKMALSPGKKLSTEIYKTATRKVILKDDELIFTTWIGLWSMIGLMCSILGATMTMINIMNDIPISLWYVFFILFLIFGVNLLFGKKMVIINKDTHVITRIIHTLLFKLTKQVNINEFDKILVIHDLSSRSYTHHGGRIGANENNARTVSLVKMIHGINYTSNDIELADFYDNEGYKIFTRILAEHIGWKCPTTMILGNEEVPTSFY